MVRSAHAEVHCAGTMFLVYLARSSMRQRLRAERGKSFDLRFL